MTLPPRTRTGPHFGCQIDEILCEFEEVAELVQVLAVGATRSCTSSGGLVDGEVYAWAGEWGFLAGAVGCDDVGFITAGGEQN